MPGLSDITVYTCMQKILTKFQSISNMSPVTPAMNTCQLINASESLFKFIFSECVKNTNSPFDQKGNSSADSVGIVVLVTFTMTPHVQ